PSNRLCRFAEGIIETVVPGQTRNSPPLDKLSTAVSAPAANDEPTRPVSLASASGPAARTALITAFGAASTAGISVGAVAGSKGEWLSSVGFFPRCTTSRLPNAFHSKVLGASKSTTTRATGGVS